MENEITSQFNGITKGHEIVHQNGLSHSTSEMDPMVGVEKNAVLVNILRGFEDFTLDASGRVISSNLEAVNITGYEEWEVIGKNFSMFYLEKDKKAGQPSIDLKNAGSSNKVSFYAWRVKKRNISFWAQVTMMSIKDDDSQVTGYKLIIKDQTHRLLSNQRLKRFRDEYLNLFNNPFIGVIKFRVNDLKFLLVNEKALHILNISGTKKNMSKVNEAFINNQNWLAFYEILLKETKVSGFEFQINSTEERWARIDCQLFLSQGFAEGVITDITESKKQLIELKRLNEELDQFVYHASHDLRSPLTTLLGLLNLAEMDSHSETLKYIPMMRERVVYLDDLLRDLASITYNNKSEIIAYPVDFTLLTQSIVSVIKESNPKWSNVDVRINSLISAEFHNDEQRLMIIFKNIVSNAFKYQNPAAKPPYLEITFKTIEDKVLITFEDNGKGIKEEHLFQIFGMFFKASYDNSGTGLGLYITKLMLDKLGGKIRVKSKIGVGTTVEVELANLGTQ